MQNRSLMKILCAILLVTLILFSFVAFIHKQKRSFILENLSNPYLEENTFRSNEPLVFPSLLSYLPVPLCLVDYEPVDNNYQYQLSTNSTRTQIFGFVKANPGVSFRGICSSLGIAVGSAQFHLGVLKKAGLVSFFRDGKYKRFFEADKFSWEKKELISLLRHDTVRRIIEILFYEGRVCHGELASKLGISSQGLTWNMNCLRTSGIIEEFREEMRVYYSLKKNSISLISDLRNYQFFES